MGFGAFGAFDLTQHNYRSTIGPPPPLLEFENLARQAFRVSI
jgi:hypothetical protein